MYIIKLQWNLSIANMLYCGHLSVVGTILRDQLQFSIAKRKSHYIGQFYPKARALRACTVLGFLSKALKWSENQMIFWHHKPSFLSNKNLSETFFVTNLNFRQLYPIFIWFLYKGIKQILPRTFVGKLFFYQAGFLSILSDKAMSDKESKLAKNILPRLLNLNTW